MFIRYSFHHKGKVFLENIDVITLSFHKLGLKAFYRLSLHMIQN